MKKLSFILFILGLFACQNKPDKPSDILDRETYKNVMKDLILAQKTQEVLKLNDSLLNPINLIYKTYSIDSVIIKKSTDYYSKNPEILKEIYDEILIELKKKKDSLIKISDNLHKKQYKKIKIPSDKKEINVTKNIDLKKFKKKN